MHTKQGKKYLKNNNTTKNPHQQELEVIRAYIF